MWSGRQNQHDNALPAVDACNVDATVTFALFAATVVTLLDIPATVDISAASPATVVTSLEMLLLLSHRADASNRCCVGDIPATVVTSDATPATVVTFAAISSRQHQ